MKKLIALALMAALASASHAAGKIGVVDMMILVRNHRSYDSNKELLTNTDKENQEKLDAMKSDLEEIQKEGTKLAEELRSPLLSQTKKAELEDKIMKVQNKFLSAQSKLRNEAMRVQQDLAALESRMLRTQAEDIKATISKYAEKNGYDLVLDTSAALYSAKSYEITDEILKAMGVDPKQAKAKESNEGK